MALGFCQRTRVPCLAVPKVYFFFLCVASFLYSPLHAEPQPLVNRQTIFDAREADNTHPLKAGPRPIKNLQATIEGAVRKSLLRNDCKGCRVKKKELNQIVMDQVARVHRELAFDTSFDFDASRSTEFFPNRVLDQGLMVTGATPRILVSKSLKMTNPPLSR